MPGPPEEVETVRWIFSQYLEGQTCGGIAGLLNQRGILSHRGKPWVYGTVNTILRGEKYVGSNVYCRCKKRLAGPLLRNPESEWVRKEGAFEPVVSLDTYKAVQALRDRRRERPSNEALVQRARALMTKVGRLNGPILDASPNVLSSHGIARRFGSLTELYRRVGYTPNRNPRYGLVRSFLTRWRQSLTGYAEEMLEEGGSTVSRNGWCLRIDGAWSLSFTVLHGARSGGTHSQQWFNHRQSEDTDVVVFARMLLGDPVPLDYFILPRPLFSQWPKAFYERNGPMLESCRYRSLAVLADLSHLFRKGEPWSG